MHTYIHTHIHTYIHTYIYTCTHIGLGSRTVFFPIFPTCTHIGEKKISRTWEFNSKTSIQYIYTCGCVLADVY